MSQELPLQSYGKKQGFVEHGWSQNCCCQGTESLLWIFGIKCNTKKKTCLHWKLVSNLLLHCTELIDSLFLILNWMGESEAKGKEWKKVFTKDAASWYKFSLNLLLSIVQLTMENTRLWNWSLTHFKSSIYRDLVFDISGSNLICNEHWRCQQHNCT
jgi:hypothetical protein